MNEIEWEKQLERVGSAIDTESELQLQTTKQVIAGNPAISIVDYAKSNDVDLVVMGTHGRTGFAHLALGSVAERVIRDAPCPVTVLGPHDGENATISHAVAEIEPMVGGGWEIGEEEGRG